MYIKGKYSWLKHFDFMLIDVITLIISFSVSYYLKFDDNSWIYLNQWIMLLLLVCFINIIMTFLTNQYSGVLKRRLYEDAIKSFFQIIYNLATTSFIFYVLKIGTLFSREMLITMYFLFCVISNVVKAILKKHILKKKINKKRPIYVVCEKEKEETIKSLLLEGMDTYEIIGISYDGNFLSDLLKRNSREVFISIDPSGISNETFDALIANGIGVHINIESLIGIQTENQFVSKVGVYKTLSVGIYSFTPNQMLYLGIKRLFDILSGILGLIILIPLSIFVKIAYLIKGDTNSIFYTQERVGKDGKIINIYKFRSMVPNAEEVLEELLKDEKYKKEWDETQKFENDPRITKVGNFLRKTSLDEIPQLINVLKGEMSLVGPRPLVKGELEAHDGLKLYNKVKPGITGWWGCNGRSNLDYRKRLELEYYYIKNCSLYLDIVCIFKTFFSVLKRDGSK